MMMTEDQIKHLEDHQAEFNDLMCGERDIREYAVEYADDPDMYINLCNDMELEPVKETYKPKQGEIAGVDLFGELQADGSVKLGTAPRIGDDRRTHLKAFPDKLEVEGTVYTLEDVRTNQWHGRDQVEKDNPEDPRLSIVWGVYV